MRFRVRMATVQPFDAFWHILIFFQEPISITVRISVSIYSFAIEFVPVLEYICIS